MWLRSIVAARAHDLEQHRHEATAQVLSHRSAKQHRSDHLAASTAACERLNLIGVEEYRLHNVATDALLNGVCHPKTLVTDCNLFDYSKNEVMLLLWGCLSITRRGYFDVLVVHGSSKRQTFHTCRDVTCSLQFVVAIQLDQLTTSIQIIAVRMRQDMILFPQFARSSKPRIVTRKRL